jgi:hypothetical protein
LKPELNLLPSGDPKNNIVDQMIPSNNDTYDVIAHINMKNTGEIEGSDPDIHTIKYFNPKDLLELMKKKGYKNNKKIKLWICKAGEKFAKELAKEAQATVEATRDIFEPEVVIKTTTSADDKQMEINVIREVIFERLRFYNGGKFEEFSP